MEPVILRNRPSQYLKQGLSHCGVFAVKAILSSLEKDDKARPEDYHVSHFGRLLGFALPTTLSKILAAHDVPASVKNADELPDEQKLEIIKNQLRSGRPAMIRIGNGYSRKTGKWHWLQYIIMGHWITVWGFDDTERVFFVYDPAVPDALDDRGVPIGNKRRTYKEMLRDWSWNGIQLIALKRFLYIKIL